VQLVHEPSREGKCQFFRLFQCSKEPIKLGIIYCAIHAYSNWCRIYEENS
jgi:hypothetical protein